jgi:microcystin-dependent protein
MALFQAYDLETTVSRVWKTTFNEQSWLLYAFQGALALLNTPDNWDQLGNVTPDQASQLGFDLLDNLRPVVTQIGLVVPFAGVTANIPANLLLCDGTSYLRTAYPDLFSAIGTTWGAADGTHFNVPDLRSRDIIGAGQGPGLSNRTLGQLIGEENHTLTQAEMPSHSHSVTSSTASVAQSPILPVPSAIPNPIAVTGNTGGGGAHNNMPPGAVMNICIIATDG